ncbi:hypothetical protein PsorP6_006964 [Peronosclerospora sorghi]|uniref:Uncharacterized protein n=1 Tax=Peronosclerospora sorghi TaxID=230839 RepID=A0ACC0WD49_9STRA|nr:hypothetical protein PsorP6_006964 [Peronosclerospora sorghi]
MGGTGLMKEWPFERLMRDCRILSIFEGTNEILRMLITLSGIPTAGDRLSAVDNLLQNPLSDLSSVAKEVSGRLKRKFSPALLHSVHLRLRDLAELLQRRTVQFGDTVEYLLRKHEKKIIDEQMQLERIAESAIALFAMTATISRVIASLGIASSEHERKLTTLYCDMASNTIATLLDNHYGYAKGNDVVTGSQLAATKTSLQIFGEGHHLLRTYFQITHAICGSKGGGALQSADRKAFNDRNTSVGKPQLLCETCDVRLLSEVDTKLHYKGRKHKNLLRR